MCFLGDETCSWRQETTTLNLASHLRGDVKAAAINIHLEDYLRGEIRDKLLEDALAGV